MTYAPASLTAARSLLLAHLPGLDSAAVGIVGDAAHRGGYHCGSDRLDTDDYSVRESSRDKSGLTEAASALDVGQWSTRVAGKAHDLRSMSVWLVAQCKAGAPDTRDIREIIYSPDGATVRRWDRLGKRSGGDSSHRWHTHVSYHRDAIKAGRNQTAIYRRYLTEIGLVAREDDDMTPDQDSRLKFLDGRVEALTYGREQVRAGFPGAGDDVWVVRKLNEVSTVVADLAARPAPGTVVISDDQLERVLRKVVGSVDGSPA